MLGKLQAAKTPGDYADDFVEATLQSGQQFARIDVIFDCHCEAPIKAGMRERCGKNTVAISRPSANLSLPVQCDNFTAHAENKADLVHFLSQQLILKAPPNKITVAAGGFSDDERVDASDASVNVEALKAKPEEEADTCG